MVSIPILPQGAFSGTNLKYHGYSDEQHITCCPDLFLFTCNRESVVLRFERCWSQPLYGHYQQQPTYLNHMGD